MNRLRTLLLVFLALVPPATPAEEGKPLSRLAFGSCIHQDRDQTIWTPIVAFKPERFLFLGDNIYADTQDIDAMRKMYAQMAAQPGYQKLLAACPIVGTWDDHDYGGDDAGADYPKKKESQEAFLDFFRVSKDSPLRKQEGIYQASIHGPAGKRVQIILLDMRYYRSNLKKDLKRPRNLGQYVPLSDPQGTLLGAAQWAWLKEQLLKPAEVRLLCSSVQLVAEDHGFEKWMNIPHERARLFDLLRETRTSGLIALSGDRHLAELSVMDAGIGYPLYDLTSSGMNMANKRYRKLEPNRHRLAIMDVGNNFGTVRIDWDRADPLICLEIRDDEGDVQIGHKIPLSRLKRGKTALVKGGNGDLAGEALKHLDREWTAEFTVQATGGGRSKTRLFLNSEKDFRSERNLTIVLEMKTLSEDLKKARITDPQKHYQGKKIKVTGTVELYQDRPQIRVTRLEQIKEE